MDKEDLLILLACVMAGVVLGMLYILHDLGSTIKNEEMFTKCLKGDTILLDSNTTVKCEVSTNIFPQQQQQQQH